MSVQNAIVYCRVSTDEQAQLGHSLQYQEAVLRSYCQAKSINIVQIYHEDFSAKTFNRPQFKKIREYIKSNRRGVDVVLFTKWDRFSRNI